jgi:hypothetical protein
MSDYTPTTEDVRARHAARDTAGFDAGASAFDRWLAAHDAEVRARVAAEEPEWEYGVDHEGDGAVEKFGWKSYAAAKVAETRDGIFMRRRKAGPWVPVKQEGESDA